MFDKSRPNWYIVLPLSNSIIYISLIWRPLNLLNFIINTIRLDVSIKDYYFELFHFVFDKIIIQCPNEMKFHIVLLKYPKDLK